MGHRAASMDTGLLQAQGVLHVPPDVGADRLVHHAWAQRGFRGVPRKPLGSLERGPLKEYMAR